ncbi:uncharacterized protein F4822DRAFT_221206 [Hypoxylon trugodes]|uniref:uncharacterized protein n=1 Tax=Hypoxylon trugodes TaxID=326681 RepID=UPI00219D3028|nr:uncharacterized protein F4822DRAFT_221206 [Hypoxylon trugodes]KAI1390025.1 hypothetical protein F4822DRAFT_221206 [Hypoxylon trugodes]
MRSPILPNAAMILVMCTSLAAALPLDVEETIMSKIKSIRSNDCSMDKIQECVADTGLESTICFAQVCAGIQEKPRMIRRQDQCTEENLLQCAVMEWREAEVCFQELCL